VKWERVLLRLALVSLAAGVFIGLTEIWAGFMQPPVVSSRLQAARLHRPSGPQVSQFPEFIGEGMGLALLVAVGRIVFRLRLSGVSRREERLTSLNLSSGGK